MNEKGKTFQKEKKGKERKGEERKHFRRRNGEERSRNILEGETERKGVETFWKEKRKGKEQKPFTEKKEGKKNKKGRESLQGVLQRCGGLWGTLFPLF